MKKGFQLSISVIVTIIIAIVLLGMGILFLNKFIGDIDEIKTELDAETDKQLSVLLESGQKLAVPFNSFDLRRGDSKVFGVGILNIHDEQNYRLEVVFSNAFDKDDNQLPGADVNVWVRYDQSEVSILSKDQFKTAILFTVPKDAPSGTYIFNVEVYGGTELYGTLQKIYVEVP